jgi:hypothetical protein
VLCGRHALQVWLPITPLAVFGGQAMHRVPLRKKPTWHAKKAAGRMQAALAGQTTQSAQSTAPGCVRKVPAGQATAACPGVPKNPGAATHFVVDPTITVFGGQPPTQGVVRASWLLKVFGAHGLQSDSAVAPEEFRNVPTGHAVGTAPLTP